MEITIDRSTRSGTLVGPGTKRKLRPAIGNSLRGGCYESMGILPARALGHDLNSPARLWTMIYEISGGRLATPPLERGVYDLFLGRLEVGSTWGVNKQCELPLLASKSSARRCWTRSWTGAIPS